MQRPHCKTIKSEALGNKILIVVVLKVPPDASNAWSCLKTKDLKTAP